MVDCFAGYQKRAAGVGFKDSVPLFEAELFKGGGIEDSSVVDEEVEPSELGGDGGDCLARGGLRATSHSTAMARYPRASISLAVRAAS